jgi:hypothetical protein
VTAERRLAKVEAALTPTQRVLAWLDEAHSWGTLSAYVDSLLDKSPDDFPINRLADDAATATRAALRGKPAEAMGAAVRKAVLATVFRFHLVLRINVVTHETIDRETLIYVAMAGQLALLGREDGPDRLTDEGYLRRLAMCRDITMSRVDHWLALQQARSMAEERYLEGRAAVFPDTAADEAERLKRSMELAVMADATAELDGLAPFEPAEPEAITAQAGVLVADLVEPARVTTLEQFDEGRRGLEIATAWLRSKASRAVDDRDPAAPGGGATMMKS